MIFLFNSALDPKDIFWAMAGIPGKFFVCRHAGKIAFGKTMTKCMRNWNKRWSKHKKPHFRRMPLSEKKAFIARFWKEND